jgi:hypothetical protein
VCFFTGRRLSRAGVSCRASISHRQAPLQTHLLRGRYLLWAGGFLQAGRLLRVGTSYRVFITGRRLLQGGISQLIGVHKYSVNESTYYVNSRGCLQRQSTAEITYYPPNYGVPAEVTCPDSRDSHGGEGGAPLSLALTGLREGGHSPPLGSYGKALTSTPPSRHRAVREWWLVAVRRGETRSVNIHIYTSVASFFGLSCLFFQASPTQVLLTTGGYSTYIISGVL